jgi:putative nucleotidyltransferase with HDIG domain
VNTTLQLVGLLAFLLAAAVLWAAMRRGGAKRPPAAGGRIRPARTSLPKPVARPKPAVPLGSAPPATRPASPPAPGPAPSVSSARGAPPPLPKVTSVVVKKRVDLEAISFAGQELEIPRPRAESPDTLRAVIERAHKVTEALTARRGIIESFHGGENDPRKLSDLVLRDPLLAAQVLKAINSPYYGLPNPIGSVFRAILLMGHVEVRNLIWRASLVDSSDSFDEDTQARMKLFWDHSFAVSRTSYAIAKSLGLPNPDEISTAGLLHDVGKLIAISAWPQAAQTLYPRLRFSDHPVLEQEMTALRLGHAHVGAELIASWALPSSICAAIENHHHPSYLPPSEVAGDAVTIAVVHAADLLCHIHNCKDQPGALAVYRPRDGWLQRLGVRNSLAKLLDERVVMALEYQSEETAPPARSAPGREQRVA